MGSNLIESLQLRSFSIVAVHLWTQCGKISYIHFLVLCNNFVQLFLYVTIVEKIGYAIFIVRLTFHQCICNNTAIMQSDKIHCHFGTFYDKKGIFFRLQRRTCLSIHFLGHYVNQWYISSWQKHNFLVKFTRNG